MSAFRNLTSDTPVRPFRRLSGLCRVVGLMLSIACVIAAHGGEKVPTFEDPFFLTVVGQPWGLTSADANENGYPDLAVTTSLGRIVIFLNSGDWSDPEQGLQWSQTLVVPGDPGPNLGEAEFADMDGDEHLDLVVAANGQPGLYVFLADDQNPGHYTQNPTRTYPLSQSVYGLVVADLNNNGWKDVALAATQVDEIIFMWNTGDSSGELERETEFDLELPDGNDYPLDLVAGHFVKNPGQLPYLDLVTGNEMLDSITVVTNLGSEDFSVETISKDPCETPSWMFSTLTSARFHIGKISPDVAGTEAMSGYYSAIFHSDSQGGFSHDCDSTQGDTYPLSDVGLAFPWGVHNGNLNGGAKLDLAYALWSEPTRSGGDKVSVLLGRGDGTFQTPSATSGYLYDVDNDPNTNIMPKDVRIVDLDQDGFGDLVTANFKGANISVLINKMIVAIGTGP